MASHCPPFNQGPPVLYVLGGLNLLAASASFLPLSANTHLSLESHPPWGANLLTLPVLAGAALPQACPDLPDSAARHHTLTDHMSLLKLPEAHIYTPVPVKGRLPFLADSQHHQGWD